MKIILLTSSIMLFTWIIMQMFDLVSYCLNEPNDIINACAIPLIISILFLSYGYGHLITKVIFSSKKQTKNENPN